MGIALTDILVELSSLKAQLEFKRNPTKFLEARPLTDSEKDALLGDSAPALRAEASAPPHLVEGRAAKLMVEAKALPHLVEGRAAKLMVESGAGSDASPTSGCVDWVRRAFVDDDGRMFRLECD